MPLNELDFIKKLLKPVAGKNSLGLNDDCAVFGEYVITKDVLSSGTHFFPNDNPFNLSRKALRVNLSDLAAMGAKPFGFLLGLSLPKNTPEHWLQGFVAGLTSDIKKYKIQMLGGDTISHDAPLNISITAIGKTSAPILRSNARVGDNIFVSGKIGESFLGLKGDKNYKEKYELPNPRITLGIKLREIANSCIDISDGLLLDLSRICEASKLGAEIFSEQIPIPESKYSLLELISAGDDYELLFTSSKERVKGCYKIGRIIKQKTLLLDGKKILPKGYVH